MRSLPLIIAHRYLFAKKSQNIINIISMISSIGIMVGTAALIIVLSVFNGLNGFVGSLFGTFDPDLKIVPLEGKTFEADSTFIVSLQQIDGVNAASAVLTDNALLKFSDRQMPAMVMGVDEQYSIVTDIDSIMYDGFFGAGKSTSPTCALGSILAGQLGAHSNSLSELTIYAPRRTGKISTSMPEQSFIQRQCYVCGVFAVQQIEYDANYAIISLDQARELFCYTNNEVSSICIRIQPNTNIDNIKNIINQKLPENLIAKDRWQQHESFFKMMEVEKFMAFIILTFIIIIAAFNIIGSLSMLIHEKKESIFILKSMGASKPLVTKVFLYEGWLISLGGVLIGLVIGIILVLLQQNFGIISFAHSENYIIDAYPVELQFIDVLFILITVSLVGILAAWYPVKSIISKYYLEIKN